MIREIKKLFGDRVALQLVEEEYEGLLVPGPTTQRMHVLSKVLAVGDSSKGVHVGDILFWQMNGIIERNCRYFMDGIPVFVLMRGDMVARLTSCKVNLTNFQVIGDWCLVRRVVEQPSKIIVLPDSVQEVNQDLVLRFYLEQKGETVDMDVQVGDEVIVDRMRANPLKIDKTNFCYLHKGSILGTVHTVNPDPLS
jgi:co-chaperonin GroES (HSP10)